MPVQQTMYSRQLMLWLLLAASVIMAFAFQGTRGLWDPDEGRYTNVALQMMRSGDYFTPHRHHETMHVTKPPVTYWAIAGSAMTFGKNEWALRAPMALAFILTVFLVYGLGKSFVPQRPWLPALIYLSSPIPMLATSAITTDTLLACAETAALLAYARYRFSNKNIRWLDAMWAIFGVAFMIKGPPALLPLLAILVWEWRTSRLKVLARPLGLLLFVVLGFSWFAAITYQNPELLTYFFGHEVVDRIASANHNRNAQWYGGFLVYLPTLALGALPWLGVVIWRKWLKQEQTELPDSSKFLWLWLLLPLVVFMISRSRLPFYVLPLFIPISLLLAQRLQHTDIGRKHIIFAAIWLVALVGTKALIAYAPSDQDARQLAREISPFLSKNPKELVFIDTKASYGLHFYLGTEIEKISIEDLVGPQLPSDAEYDHDLNNELFEAEPDRYFLVPPGKQDAFVRAVAARNMRANLRGSTRKLAVYDITRNSR